MINADLRKRIVDAVKQRSDLLKELIGDRFELQTKQHWDTCSTTGSTGSMGMAMVMAFPRDAP